MTTLTLAFFAYAVAFLVLVGLLMFTGTPLWLAVVSALIVGGITGLLLVLGACGYDLVVKAERSR